MRRPALVVIGLLVLLLAAGCAGDDAGPEVPTTTTTDPSTTTTLAGPLAELPVPRTEVSGVAWAGGLAVGGGLTPDGGASDLFHRWDPATNRWGAGPALPRPLHHSALVVLGDRLWVIGGYTNGPGQPWEPQGLVASLGVGETNWRREPSLPDARGAHAAAVAGDLLVVAGGEAGGQALASTVVYDPSTRAWRGGPDLARPREHLAAAASAGRVYAIAGRTGTEGNFAVVESLDPATPGGWRAEPDLTRARGGIGADAVGDTVCVAGGEEPAGTIAPVECITAGDATWRVVADLARPRHGLAVMALSGRLHVVGGGDQPGLFVSGAHEVVEPG